MRLISCWCVFGGRFESYHAAESSGAALISRRRGTARRVALGHPADDSFMHHLANDISSHSATDLPSAATTGPFRYYFG